MFYFTLELVFLYEKQHLVQALMRSLNPGPGTPSGLRMALRWMLIYLESCY